MRVLPLVITGAALLLSLKAAGLLLTGHYAFMAEKEAPKAVIAPTYRPSAAARLNVADYDPVTTGSVPAKKKPAPEPSPAETDKAEVPALEGQPQAPPKDVLENKPSRDPSSAEKALLDRLQSRRVELDGRAQELDLRENLLRAAEKKIEDQIVELKTSEQRLAAAEQARKAEEEEKLKGLVVMYENMKPKQAAAIFDRLEMKVLIDVATRMDPKKTGEIVAKMEPDAAQRLTVALAKREAAKAPADTDTLPKIEGQKP